MILHKIAISLSYVVMHLKMNSKNIPPFLYPLAKNFLKVLTMP